MHFENDRLIKRIHASSAYGRIIEVGAGQPISNALLRVEGASGTIESAMSPYSKGEQDRRYPEATDLRYVCRERVAHVLQVEHARAAEEASGVNLIMATSFSLAMKGCAHGYIGIRYEPHPNALFYRIYHITLPKDLSRGEMIDLIGYVGVHLLGLVIKAAQYPIAQIPTGDFMNFVDDVRDESGATILTELLDLRYNHNRAHATEHAVVILPSGNAERFETVCRESDEIAIFKGSFSILHNMHIAMAETVAPGWTNPNSKRRVLFTICLQTYGKGMVDIHDLQHRISMITKAGYTVLILNNPLFSENHAYLRERSGKSLVYVAGGDTVARLNETCTVWMESRDVHFAWFQRPGAQTTIPPVDEAVFEEKHSLTIDVASSQLIKAIVNGDTDALKGRVPDHVHAYYQQLETRHIRC